jgi:LacI family transcriptional regulator
MTDGRNLRRRVTLKDVARDAGVSRATASLVVRESPMVADGTRARVLGSMARLGYVYHRGAASLRGRRTQTLGLIVTEVTNPFFGELTTGVEAEIDKKGYVLLLGHSHDSLEQQARLLRTMFEYSVDGLLLCPAPGTTVNDLEVLAGLPCVMIARRVAGAHQAGYVGANNRLGAELATRHLLQHGARRVAFVGGPVYSSSRAERAQGVEAALADAHLALRPEWSVPSPSTWEGGYEVARRLLRRSHRPDAIVSYNDVVAFGVLVAALDMGLQPGADVLVTGFDGITASAHQKPSLTTVSTQPRELGRRAGWQLTNLIEYTTAEPEPDIPAPVLVTRESCGCPPAPKGHSL